MDSLIYMRIQGVDGEEPVGTKQKLIKIVGFDHSVSIPTSPQRPSVGEHARLRRSYCEHGLFTVRKLLDKTSGKIFELCLKGPVVENVAVYLCRADEESSPLKKGEFGPDPLLSILMQKVVVVHFSYEMLLGWPTERVDFQYTSITWKLDWPEPDKGVENNLSAVGWDGLLNKPEPLSDYPPSVTFKS